MPDPTGGPLPVRIVVPWNVGRTSPNRRLHWAVRRELVGEARSCARVAWLQAGSPVLAPPVRVDVIVRRGRQMDVDNCVAACKPLIDGLFVRALVADDGPSFVRLGAVTQDCGRVWRGREEVEFVVVACGGEEDGQAG